jgi:hypothetical protein
MRKYVYVKIQRILMFIPLANISILFIWLYNCHVLPIPKRTVFKGNSLAIFIFFILAIVQRLFYLAFGIDLDAIEGTITIEVLRYIFAYLYPFTIAYSLVRFQKKLGLE